MAKRQLPSPEVLRQLLRHDPETGKLFWKQRPREMFETLLAYRSWNTKYAGREALTGANALGYRMGTVLSIPLKAHRVVWAMEFGEWPSEMIDHVNCDPSDNRIANLRIANKSQNAQNAGVRKNSSVGLKGVKKVPGYEKWCARIMIDGKRTYLGYFDSPEDAHAAYSAAADRLHGEFARAA